VTCVMPGAVATNFGVNALGGEVDSRSLPGTQPPEEVAVVIAGAIESRRSGDVCTRPGALEAAIEYLRKLASGS
jgi:hypothetical protein